MNVLYHSEQHELMLYLFISLIKFNNQQCLGKYGLPFFFSFFFLSFFNLLGLFIYFLHVYLPFLHEPIKAMGDIFQ